MRKLFAAILLCAGLSTAQAAPNVFNHLGIGAAVGTNGVSFEVATPITGFVNLRAGVSYMPGITFHADADYAYSVATVNRTGMQIKRASAKLRKVFEEFYFRGGKVEFFPRP